MAKFTFDAPPPVRNLKVKVEEWDPVEDFIISELRATECQEIIAIAQSKTDQGVGLYADVLSRCLSAADGKKPSKEWLMSASFVTLKRLGDQAMKFNGIGAEAAAEIEKN